MKKQRILSLLLTCSLFLCLMMPVGITIAAEDDPSDSSGMELHKTATPNADGTSYTIELEAYATGSTFITEVTEDIPSDIVFVIDLSGSMDEMLEGGTFSKYTNYQNGDYYTLRHNGGEGNLYCKLSNGAYSPVSMTRVGHYSDIHSLLGDSKYTNDKVYSAKTNYYLYVKINGVYQLINVTQDAVYSPSSGRIYQYTYDLLNGTKIIVTGSTVPKFSDYGTDDDNIYYDTDSSTRQYIYTWKDGDVTKTSTSIGVDVDPKITLYKRISSTEGDSRMAVVKDKLDDFVDQISASAASNNIDHRVAIVGFASDGEAYNDYPYENTGLFDGAGGTRYNSLKTSHYENAFKNMNDTSDVESVRATIDYMTSYGGTAMNLGLDMAENIFKHNPIPEGEKRNRIVVLLADGFPGKGVAKNESDIAYNVQVALDTLDEAPALKNTYAATVYCVAMIKGVDPSSPGDPTLGEHVGSPAFADYLFHTISSNNGIPQNPSYYLSAATAEDLGNILTQITQQVEYGGTTVKLDEKTVIRDYVTREFDLHDTKVTLQTYRCTGKNTDGSYQWQKNLTADGKPDTMGASYTIDYEAKKVSVTGFDYSENWVGSVNDTTTGTTTYHGNKLVISFTVKPENGFLGGNHVDTNLPQSGIYEDKDSDTPVEEFPVPNVDVVIPKVDVEESYDIQAHAGNIDVYLLEDVTLEDIQAHTTVMLGTTKLELTKDNFGLQDWQHKYVDITITYTDAAGKTFTSYEDLKEDTKYSVTASIEPKTQGTETRKDDTATGTIWVYKPTLTYKDTDVWYGDTAPAGYTGNLVKTEWVHGTQGTAPTAVMGQAPALTMDYALVDSSDISDGKINSKQDIPVNVTVKIDGTDVTGNVTFAHQNCNGATSEDLQDGKFLLHPQTCSLTVTKTGGADGEPYVFTVNKDGAAYTQLTIVGNKSVTLHELPVGTYSIDEDTGWSWRYTASVSPAATLSSNKQSATITCTNTLTKETWLNSFSNVAKNIFGTKPN